MATDLELKVKVESSQLDQVEQKVGRLQQLSKNIAIQYDVDGKPLDVVIDKSLNLRKQVGELTKALRSCLLYTSPSPRDRQKSRMPSSA